MITRHPDHGILAARIAVSNLHKETKKVFSDVINDLYHIKNKTNTLSAPMISNFHYKVVMENAEKLNSSIVYDRDFNYSYFELKVNSIIQLLKNQEKY